MDRVIPDPGGPFLCGQRLCGEGICGQDFPADTWTDYALQLPDGTAEVLTSAPVHVPITVEVTGTVDLVGTTAKLLLDQTTRVTFTGFLDLEGDDGKVTISYTLLPEDEPLESLIVVQDALSVEASSSR